MSAVWGCSHASDESSFQLVFALCTSPNQNGEFLSRALSEPLFNDRRPLLRQIQGRMAVNLKSSIRRNRAFFFAPISAQGA